MASLGAFSRRVQAPGQSHLNVKHFQEVSLVPSAHEAFSLETDFGRLFLFEQMQGQAPQGSEVLIRIPLPDTTVIFPKGDVQDPVQTVFNPPVAPNGRTKLLGIVTRQAAQVVTALDRGVLTHRSLCFYQREAAQPGPLVAVSKPVNGTG